MKITDMRVQNLLKPFGIGTAMPVLSYVLESTEKNQFQKAYQIVVSTSPEKLLAGQWDLWDSGKVESKQTFGITYHGKRLQSRQEAFWKVRVWDVSGAESGWSQTASWEMGLLLEKDWKAKWIGQGDLYGGAQYEAPAFVRDFRIESLDEITCARLYISGLGIYHAEINGKDISDTVFDPGESDAGKTVYYAVYDVLNLLLPGENRIGVILGNGQYTNFILDPVMEQMDGTESDMHRYQKNDGIVLKEGICGRKKFIVQLELTDKAGKIYSAVSSDAGWLWRKSPIIFQNWYGGEDYDATLEQDNWSLPKGAEESAGWMRAVVMEAPQGKLTAREFLPIKIMERFRAQSVRKLDNGNWIVDMGRNGAGFAELRLEHTTKAMRGTWIKMYPAEMLNADGEGVNQESSSQSWTRTKHCVIMNSYRLKGSGRESWHPVFCYQGFRYVEVEGFPGELSPENFWYCIVRTCNDKNGEFSCSDPILNSIDRMVAHSIESNMYGSFTDCPQIEKLGWIETSHLMFRSISGSYDISSWMKKIIHDIADGQVDEKQAKRLGEEPEGFVPGIIPEFQRINGLYKDPNWNGACVFTPWEYYQYYGDTGILKQTYPMMIKYIKYLTECADDGILEDYAQMGEWGEYGEKTPTVLVATCSYYRMLSIGVQVSALMGEGQDLTWFVRQRERVAARFHEHPKCYHPETGVYGSGSQASFGCALFCGIVPEERRQETVQKLAEVIRLNEYHLTSGEVGLKQVFTVLAEAGRSDVIYRMVMNRTRPSYRAFAEAGFTTLPEYWNYDELWQGMIRSRNHAMMGHVKEWITCYMLGIRPVEPGFSRLVISPYLPENITHMQGALTCPYGKAAVEYIRECDGLHMKVILPVGVQAVVKQPYIDGISSFEEERNVLARAGSGEYHFFVGWQEI